MRRRFPSWRAGSGFICYRQVLVAKHREAPDNDNWERIHLGSAQYVIYCPKNHPFAKRAKISLTELAPETDIVPEKGSLTRRLLEQACHRYDISLNRVATTTTFPLMCEAVLQGIGVAGFLQNSSLIKDNIREINIEEMPEARNTYLIATKDRTRLKLVSELINAAIE